MKNIRGKNVKTVEKNVDLFFKVNNKSKAFKAKTTNQKSQAPTHILIGQQHIQMIQQAFSDGGKRTMTLFTIR